MNDRIRLAEAMLDAPEGFATWDEYRQAVKDHTGSVLKILLALIPDPEHDANDCNALIEYLRSDYRIEIDLPHHDTTDVAVRFYSSRLIMWDWSGDNWMHGVCELALKVIATDGDRQ